MIAQRWTRLMQLSPISWKVQQMNSKTTALPANFRSVHFLEMVAIGLLCLSAVNLLMVLVTGGYRLNLRFARIAAYSLDGPLLLFLILAMATIMLRARRRGIPVSISLRGPLLLFLGVVFVYSLNGRALPAGDTIPASYLPLSLLREFDFDLDEFPFLYEGEMPWFVQRINGRIASAYPPWAGVMAIPVYLLPVLGGLSAQSPWIHDLEKLSATLITALSVVLLLFTLRRLTTEKIAWYIAIVYAFATSSFSSSSQALWQHGPSQLFLALTIYWLVKGIDEPRFSAYAGLALGSAIICRPSNAFVAIPIAAYVLLKRRDQFLGFCLATLPPLLWFMAYNMHYYGSPVSTGFAVGIIDPSRLRSLGSHLFKTPLSEGLAGILMSPSRGLFIYSPILPVAFVGMVMVWRNSKLVLLKYLSLAPLLTILLTSKWINWWGGGSYGPRLLADITPFLCLYLYPPFERAQSRPLLKSAIAVLIALSIGLHGLRVFAGGDWNGHPFVDWHPERLWSWADSPVVYYGKNTILDAVAEVKRRILAFPTSRDAPHKLAAFYHLNSLEPGATLLPGGFLLCRVNVMNTGGAVWLDRAQWEKGEVRLRWRWFEEEHERPFMEGGWLLGYDVLPGQAYEFTIEIATPRNPGNYVLELGLVSMQVTSFADQGTAPLRVPIRVTAPPPGG
jgi:Dolichyl-phosphate-mannose-protein mannosyltransferase